MPDTQYGNSQTPSSRPPEPPYRASSNQAGYGAGGAVGANAQPDRQPDLSGIDTTGEVPSTGSYAPIASSDLTESFQEARSGSTASMPAGSYSSPYNGRHSAQAQNAAQQQYSQQSQVKAPAKQKSGAGKTFLFGFLGALVACALSLGGFAAWQSASGAKTAANLTGTSESMVINAEGESLTLSEAVAAKALPSVVAVYNYQEQQSYGGYFGYGYGYGNGTENTGELVASGMGSGVVISDDGYIITNYHVVENAAKLTVTVDGKERDATYVGGDSSSDVAVLKVDDTSGLVAVEVGDSDKLVIGEWVMTIGAPLGLEQSVATGVVSATNRSTVMDSSSSSDSYGYYFTNATPEYTYYPNMIQTDAVINPGNSGGALVDAEGKLIGINSMLSSYSSDYAGVGFAIPINYAISIANDIIAGKEPSHAALGVSISQVNSQTAQRYNLSTSSGAYIANIYEGTGAADSDLKVGDIITQIDDSAISSTTDVTLEVREHKVGDTVTVTVNRDGETLEIPVVLTSDDAIASAAVENTGTQNPFGGDTGQDQGQGQGQGQGNDQGYTDEELREFMRMLGF